MCIILYNVHVQYNSTQSISHLISYSEAITRTIYTCASCVVPRNVSQIAASTRIGAGMVPGTQYIRVRMHAGMRAQVLIDIPEA